MDAATAPVQPGEFRDLEAYLREQARRCARPPVDRFRHPWLAPCPPSAAVQGYLAARQAPGAGAAALADDRFARGDYGLGLFHHDVSEAALELVRHPVMLEAVAGSLLCFLECASPEGCVHRTELPHRVRDVEPAKPVVAQLAWRVFQALEREGPAWAHHHRVLERVTAFLDHLEQRWTGHHGLPLTPSSRASGFDSDLLSAGFPDRCIEGPDTASLLVLEYRAAAHLAGALGAGALVLRFTQRADHVAERINSLLWHQDACGGFYGALRWRDGLADPASALVSAPGPDGVTAPLESWTSLLPLYAGVVPAVRLPLLTARLLDPAVYWGPWGVRTLPATSLFFQQAPRVMLQDPRRDAPTPVSNWSGPVWVLSNYYLASGLAAAGERARARELALKTARLLAADLRTTGMLHECYDDAGRGLWPRTGTFISWNVLALTLVREHVPEAGVA